VATLQDRIRAYRRKQPEYNREIELIEIVEDLCVQVRELRELAQRAFNEAALAGSKRLDAPAERSQPTPNRR